MTEEIKKNVDNSRRDFLKKAGKIAVYAPPAMLALSSPSFKAIARSSGSADEQPNGNGGSGGGLSDFLRWLLGLFR